MLILSRKPGDAILIDGGIRVVVLACEGGGVRLGIEAPASIGILREEIVKDIADENIRAGSLPEDQSFLDALKRRPAEETPEEASDSESAGA